MPSSTASPVGRGSEADSSAGDSFSRSLSRSFSASFSAFSSFFSSRSLSADSPSRAGVSRRADASGAGASRNFGNSFAASPGIFAMKAPARESVSYSLASTRALRTSMTRSVRTLVPSTMPSEPVQSMSTPKAPAISATHDTFSLQPTICLRCSRPSMLSTSLLVTTWVPANRPTSTARISVRVRAVDSSVPVARMSRTAIFTTPGSPAGAGFACATATHASAARTHRSLVIRSLLAVHRSW